MTVEHEVKLSAPDDFVLPDPAAGDGPVTWTTIEPRSLDAQYHDGTDLPLLRQGITVRRRTGEGTRWTIKFPTDEVAAAGGVARREVDVVTEDEGVPDDVVALLEPFLDGVELVPVARLRSERTRTALVGPDGERLGEIDDDRVVAEAEGGDGTPVSFREVEVEFDPHVPAELIESVVARLEAAGARPSDGRSKLERSLGLLGLATRAPGR